MSTTTEHLDVLIVGAGLSGIGAGHFVQAECPWASYAIFEARGAIGGTWDLFRYPGLRSDSDMFTLGYSFRPWDGKQSIADGDKILQYIKDTAAEEGIDQKIRFHHKLVAANWSTPDGCWQVTAERTDPDTGATERVELTAGFIYSCTGYYRYDKGYQPDFPGMDSFEGTIVHPQFWPEDLDYSGKKVVVIGSGATAVTLIPSLAKDAAHVTMLQRSPTYIATIPAVDPLANAIRRVLPTAISGPTLRWVRALLTQGSYHLSHRRPKLVKAVLRRQVTAQLPKGYDIDKHFTPSYNPWDQRLCADANGGLFKAISSGAASVVTDHIDTFTPQGIALQSGDKVDADIIVTATGLELLFIGGAEITVDDEAHDVSNRLVYKGTMIEGVPNFAVGLGYTNASWTLKVDLSSDFVTRLLNRMRKDGLRQCTPVNHDPTVGHAPMFSLNSGYINRAVDQMPKQGTKFPWQVHQSYLRDFRALKLGSLDEAMEFSNPVPSKTSTAKV